MRIILSENNEPEDPRALLEECLKERDLLIKIFAERVVPALKDHRQQLREYLNRIHDAVINGPLRRALCAYFGDVDSIDS